MDILPREILVIIFSQLDINTKLIIGQVCTYFRAIIFASSGEHGENLLWKDLQLYAEELHGLRTYPFLSHLAPCFTGSLDIMQTPPINVWEVLHQLPAFPNVCALVIDHASEIDETSSDQGAPRFNSDMLRLLDEKFPGLVSLVLPARIENYEIAAIPQALPSLQKLELPGCWEIAQGLSVDRFRSLVTCFEHIEVVIHQVQLSDKLAGSLVDVLAESKMAKRIRVLIIDNDYSGEVGLQPKLPICRFSSLGLLKIVSCLHISKTWLASMKEIKPLKTLCFLGDFYSNDIRHDWPDIDILPANISIIHFQQFFNVFVPSNVILSLSRRLSSLTSVAFRAHLDFDIFAAIQTLVNPQSCVEYVYMRGQSKPERNPRDQFQRIHEYLMAQAESLAFLKLLWLETFRSQGIDNEEYRMENLDLPTLRQRLPAEKAILVFATTPVFSLGEEEDKRVKALKGWQATKCPPL